MIKRTVPNAEIRRRGSPFGFNFAPDAYMLGLRVFGDVSVENHASLSKMIGLY